MPFLHRKAYCDGPLEVWDFGMVMDTKTNIGIWHDTPQGFCAEISMLAQGKSATSLLVIVLPTGERVRLSQFRQHRDGDGDVTHWSLDRLGQEFIIFND